MKIFLIILILIFNIQSLTKADDIRDFQIEGFSVGDKLSEKMSIKEIDENIVPYFQDQRKYYIVGKTYDLNQYDQIEFYIKSNDKSYEIRTIGAGIFINDLDECLEKKKKLLKN